MIFSLERLVMELTGYKMSTYNAEQWIRLNKCNYGWQRKKGSQHNEEQGEAIQKETRRGNAIDDKR